MKRPKIIWIPGWACDARMMQKTAREVGDHYDHVTIGWQECLRDWQTNWRTESLGDSMLPAALLKKMADARGPVILAGCSLGGMLALRAAATRPEGVAAVIAISSTLHFASESNHAGTPRKLRAMRQKLAAPEGLHQFLVDFFAAALAPCMNETLTISLAGRALARFNRTMLARGLDYLAEENLSEIKKRVKAPCLQMHGGDDRIISVACAESIVNTLPNVTYQVLPEQGHLLPLLASPQTGEIIRRFLVCQCL